MTDARRVVLSIVGIGVLVVAFFGRDALRAVGRIGRSRHGVWTAKAGRTRVAGLENLGNPHRSSYGWERWVYARNPWDLQAFGGKLYIGGGNSSNEGPEQNAGPVPLIVFDPATGAFEAETSVDDEQIDVIHVLDGQLIVPGHDPRESWEKGNFYRRETSGRWTKVRNLPGAIHTYAIASDGGRFFAGLSTEKGSAIAISGERGRVWKVHATPGQRIHAFLTVGGVVYSTDVLVARTADRYVPVHALESGIVAARRDLDVRALLPGIEPGNDSFRVVKPAVSGKECLYIGGRCHNDHQFLPVGLFRARSLAAGAVDVKRIPLPGDARVWDVMVHGDTAYALLDQPADGGRRVSVLASKDLEAWKEELSFTAGTFARSFELLNGKFYFGLGCEVDELHPATGEILRKQATRDRAGGD